MKNKLIAFRTRAGETDVTPDLELLKKKFPEMNESEVIRMCLMTCAKGFA